MVRKMNHPMQISPEYVPIRNQRVIVDDDVLVVAKPKRKTGGANTRRVYDDQILANKHGEAKTYFYPYTVPRRARAFLILGSGDKEKGYLKYLLLEKTVLKTFKTIRDELKRDRKLGSFSIFLNREVSYMSSVIIRLNTKGITSYSTLIDTDKMNKQYIKFLKEIA